MQNTFSACYEQFYSQAEIDKARLLAPTDKHYKAAWKWVHSQAAAYFRELEEMEDEAEQEKVEREQREKNNENLMGEEVWNMVHVDNGERAFALQAVQHVDALTGEPAKV